VGLYLTYFNEYRKSKSTRFRVTVSTLARANYSFEETQRSASSLPSSFISNLPQVFRFSTSKTASLFLQRKNPRKIAWTQVYRRMHKKGITEEVAKKRSRKTVKHQRGIVGADLAAIAAKRNQTAAVRERQRLAAISKAKTEKKEKESKKAKVSSFVLV
jgi:large subunit ribosomal protein L24e